MLPLNNSPRKSRLWLRSLVLAAVTTLMTALPIKAAEEISAIFGPIKLSLRIESLEAFAQDGTINQNLGFYLNFTGATSQEIAQFRQALTDRAEIDPLLLARILNDDIGEELLKRIGRIINIQGGGNGKFAIRAALIQAALDSQEGLTVINFLRYLPTNIQIDVSNVLQLSRSIEIIVKATKQFTEDIAELSASEVAQATPLDFAKMPDLRQPGEFGVQAKVTWHLIDNNRNRRFYVDVYKPQKWRSGKTPVIVMSHGLASNPEHFTSVAKHLASYGYVVVAPQHPGSDFRQAQRLIEGFSRQIFILEEFLDRPKDISYTIDELAKRNQAEFEGRLDLKSVAVGGHSFGGYTALAVGGATLDFDNLQRECNRYFLPNTALLLQCQALKLPHKDYNFRDERVTSIVLVNPVNSAIFGKQGLAKVKIPVLVGAGTYDPATPIVFEQVRSFPWFGDTDKYLLVVEGQAHIDFAQLDAGVTDVIDSVDNLTLPAPALIQDYGNSIITAFLGVYLLKDEQTYKPYLQSSYSAYLSQQQQFKAYLITNASSVVLTEMIQQFTSENPLPQQANENRNGNR
jgi:predicted dienelactone hydrolase